MNRKELFELALKHDIADRDLSHEDSLISDYGECTDSVINFTKAIIDICAEIAIEHETYDGNPSSIIHLKLLELKG